MTMTASSPGRRERKKQATRLALHEAAMELAEERGLAAVTIEDITERADVAVRTFFNYFPSKEEAVLERDPERAERFRRALAGRPATEAPLDALRHVVIEELLVKEHSAAALGRRMALVRSEPTLQAAMSAHFEELHAGVSAEIAARLGVDPATTPYPDLVAAAAFAACRVSMMRWVAEGGRSDPAAVLTEVFDLLAGGLTPPTPVTDNEVFA